MITIEVIGMVFAYHWLNVVCFYYFGYRYRVSHVEVVLIKYDIK